MDAPGDTPVDTALNDAMLAIDRTTHPFGSITIGQTSPGATFTIRNTGGVATGALGVTLTGAGAASFQIATNGCGTSALAPGLTCDVTVTFVPTSPGMKTASLEVTATPGGTVSASLDGQGIALGALTVSTTTSALGSVIVGATGTTVSIFTVTNTGGTPTGALNVQAAGSDPIDFLPSANLCSMQVLDPAETCTFSVRLRPLSAGTKSALFQISAGPGGVVSGAVTGVGLAPANLVVVPLHRSFGSVVTGQTSSTLSLLVVNTGDAPTGALAQTLAGSSAFAPVAGSTCVTAVLAGGTSCIVNLAFTPSTTGVATGQIDLEGSPGGRVGVTFSGTGIAPGGLTIAPTAHIFADTNVGATAASHQFTITNTGAASTGTLLTTLAGTHASEFRIVAGTDLCHGASLAPNASCTIAVTFAPTSSGPMPATLIVAGASGAVTAGLSGIGIGAASLEIGPPSRAFGSVATGIQSPPLAFTVRNVGGQPSGIPTASLTGAGASQFMIAGNGCSQALGPNQSCTIQVRFAPTAAASATASLAVMATPGGSLTTDLTGTGVTPGGLLIVPSAYPFPPLAIGETSPTHTLTVINTGAAASGTVAITTSGDFTTTHDCTTLAPGASCTLTVAFGPTATGLRTGTVTAIASPGGTSSVALSGVGRPRIEILSLDLGPVVTPFDFGTAVVNTTIAHDVRITVRNNTTAQAPLTVTGTFGSPAQYGVLTNTCDSANVIAAAGTCTITVRFRPTTTGASTGSIAFSIGMGAQNQVAQALTGTGTESLTLTALAGTSFGSVPINTTSTLSFRAANPAGSVTSGLIATTLAGTGYSIDADACDGVTLTAGGSCIIDVTFAPTATGTVPGTLGVSATPGGSPSLILTATGSIPVGSPPTDLTLTPSSIAEDAPTGSTLGTLTTTDADATNTFTYALVPGTGATDNSSFAIAGNLVQTSGTFDYETKITYSIRVRVTDSGGHTFEKALTINITDVDEAPVATDDTLVVDEDAAATAVNVLANDTDVDAGLKTISSVTQPTHGSVIVTGGGSALTYQPAPDYFGPDAFSYTLNGGSVGNVTVTVTAVDDAPVAVADATLITEDTASAVDVLANDTDIDGGPISIASVTQPAHGSVVIMLGQAAYTPNLNYSGPDSFTYQLSPGGSTATVSITVVASDDPPEAIADSVTVLEDAITTLAVRINDLDVDGGPMTIMSVTQPANGMVAIVNGGNDVAYQPNLNYSNDASSPDTFTYTLNGGSTATVSVIVTNTDDAPVAVDDVQTVDEDAAATAITVLANDTDIDGGPMDIISFTPPANGTIVLTPAGTPPYTGLTYQPNANYCNTGSGGIADTFTYTLHGGAVGDVAITVTCLNDAPTDITLTPSTVSEAAAIGTTVGMFSSTDPDAGNTFTYSLVGGSGSTDNAAFQVSGNTLNTAAAFDFETKSSYAIRVRSTDQSGDFFDEALTVTITNINDAPTDIQLVPSTVAENQPSGTTVGTLTTTDPDTGDTHSYALVTGAGDMDNASFLISGAQLKTQSAFDFEAKTVYFVRVRSTDPGSLTTEKALTVTVTSVNEAPTAILLSNSTVPEDAAVGATVGTLSSTDPDSGDTFGYTLVAGAGSTDNAAFLISGSTLVTNAAFDVETKSSYTIRVRSTDAGTLFFERQFTITITNVNEAPTDISLAPASVTENLPVGTSAGTFTTTDVDSATFTYGLVTGTGDTDNAAFTISNNMLLTAASFDFETKASYSIRVRSTDGGSLTVERVFTVTVLNGNEAPTDIALSATSVAENQVVNTVVGTLSSTDPDPSNTHTYTLVVGTGDTDNASFNIAGSSLRTSAVFDFETRSSYSIRVRTTDQNNLTFEESFTITVTNANESPTDIALGNASIPEDTGSGSTVGAFTTTDPDTANTHTYTLVSGTGSTDNASFVISGGNLVTNTTFDFETKASYSVRVRSTDAGSLFVEKQFTVTITDINEAPTNLTLAPASVVENLPVGTSAGTFTTTDGDSGTFTYALVVGTGDTDNAQFTISNNMLLTAASFDFETKASYTIRVRSTDGGSLFIERQFTVAVVNGNEAPTDIALSATSVAENQAVNTVVGTLSSTDPDPSNTHTYSLVVGTGDTDNAAFNIAGSSLRTSAVFDFETRSSYSIRVRTTDQNNLTFEESFTITVTNANETPTDIALSNASVPETAASGSTVGAFTTTDPDTGNTHTYTLASGAGSTDNASFVISGGNLVTSTTLDFETKTSYAIRVRSTDSGTLFVEKQFTITVTNANEAPTDLALAPSSIDESQPSGTLVGSFTTTDSDVTDTWSYTLVAGAGSTDNTSFALGLAGALTTAAVFDFETKASYSIRVRVTDGGSLFYEEAFTINVNNVNEAPTDITLTSATVAENQPVNTTVGTLGSSDPDTGNTFTYSLVAGAGSTDNASFNVSGTTLRTSAVFDFETKSSYSIRVRTTDQGSLFFDEVFTITVTNANDAPTDIALGNVSVNENAVSGTGVGTLSSSDQDASSTFTYSLVAGAGSTDNTSFQISGAQLLTNAVFNFEAKSSYTVRIRTTDNLGAFYEEAFTITIINVNDPPTDADEAAGVQSNVGISPPVGRGLLVGALDEDGDTVVVAPGTFTTALGGSITILADGSYTYRPQAGRRSVNDTYTYTVTDGKVGGDSTSTITFNIDGNTIWFVDLAAGSNGTGTVSSPFNVLTNLDTGGSAVDATSDTIFVYTSTAAVLALALPSAFDLQASQQLIGEGTTTGNAADTIDTVRGFTPASDTLALPTVNGGIPTLGAPTTDVLTLATNNVLRGFDLGNAPMGSRITGTSFGTLSITEVNIAGTGRTLNLGTGTIQGLTAGSPAAFATLSSTSSTTSSLDLTGIAGTLTANGNLLGATGRTVRISGGTLTMTFSGNMTQTGAAELIYVDGSHTGTLTFQSGTYSDTGSGGGLGIGFDNADGTYTFTGTTTLGRARGISIKNGSAGTFSFNSNTTIALTAGAAYFEDAALVSPNTIVGNATVTFNGTITQGTSATPIAATAVDINGKSGGTTTFTGSITAYTSTAPAIELTNTAGTTAFTGKLALTTTSGMGFKAAGLGAGFASVVSSTSIASTVSSTVGTAVSIVSTTIGAGNVTFEKVSSNGASSGIVLNTTGTLGGLKVLGTGGTCALPTPMCSGGSIVGSTASAVSVASTAHLAIDRMFIDNTARNGIDGFKVTNFTLTNSVIKTTGTALVPGDYEVNAIAFVDRSGADDNTLDGAVTITNNAIDNPERNGIMIETWAGTISNLNLSNNALTGGTTTSRIQDAIHVFAQGSASGTAGITTGTIDNNTITGFRFLDTVVSPGPLFIGGNGIRLVGGNTVGSAAGTLGTGANPIQIKGNDIDDVGSNMIAATFTGISGTSHLVIQNNGTLTDPMTNSEGLGISVFFGGAQAIAGDRFTALINNNFIDGVNQQAACGVTCQSGSSGIGVQSDFGVAITDNTLSSFTVSNNRISNMSGNGIVAMGINNTGSMNVRIIDNTVTTIPDLTSRFGILVRQSNVGTQPTLLLEMHGNVTAGGTPLFGPADGIGIRKQDPYTFGIEGLAPSPNNAPEAYINAQNPSGMGTTRLSGTGYVAATVPDAP